MLENYLFQGQVSPWGGGGVPHLQQALPALLRHGELGAVRRVVPREHADRGVEVGVGQLPVDVRGTAVVSDELHHLGV